MVKTLFGFTRLVGVLLIHFSLETGFIYFRAGYPVVDSHETCTPLHGLLVANARLPGKAMFCNKPLIHHLHGFIVPLDFVLN